MPRAFSNVTEAEGSAWLFARYQSLIAGSKENLTFAVGRGLWHATTNVAGEALAEGGAA